MATGFGDISLDNHRIIIIKWIAEGLSHIFFGAIVIAVASLDTGSATLQARAVFHSGCTSRICCADGRDWCSDACGVVQNLPDCFDNCGCNVNLCERVASVGL